MSVLLLAAFLFLFSLSYFTLEQNILFRQELPLGICSSCIWEAGQEDPLSSPASLSYTVSSSLAEAVSRQQNPATIANKREKVYKEPDPSKQCWGGVGSCGIRRGAEKDIFSLLSMSVLFLTFFLLRITLFFLKMKGGKLLHDFMYFMFVSTWRMLLAGVPRVNKAIRSLGTEFYHQLSYLSFRTLNSPPTLYQLINGKNWTIHPPKVELGRNNGDGYKVAPRVLV